MRQSLRVIVLMALFCVAVCAKKKKLTAAQRIERLCSTYGEGNYADVTAESPLCSTTYIHCSADNKTGEVVSGSLGTVKTPYNVTVDAVYSAFSNPGGPTLPGALGSLDCDCDAIYTQDPVTAKACKVCMALQLNNICKPKVALENPSYSCAVPVPNTKDLYFNCGLSGPYLQNGTLIVDPETAQVVLAALQDAN